MNVSQVNQPAPPAKANGLVTVPGAPKRALRKGRIKSAFRVLLYGPEKVGKSTFAAGAPSPIWLGREHGTEHLDIVRLPQPNTLREAVAMVDEVARGDWDGEAGYEIRTLVVDPIGWFEPLMHLAVTGDLTVPLAMWNGGFGKGFSAALDQWRLFLQALERCWMAGKNIVILGHTDAKQFDDPEGPGYKRYELALENKAAAGLLKQWVDHILFANRVAFGKYDKDSKKTKAFGDGARMIRTEWSPAYDAGNRASLPPEIPLQYAAFAEALEAGERRKNEYLANIEAGLTELGDPEIEKKVRAWLSERNVDVAAVANAVAAKLGERRAQVVDGQKEGQSK